MILLLLLYHLLKKITIVHFEKIYKKYQPLALLEVKHISRLKKAHTNFVCKLPEKNRMCWYFREN